MKMNIRQNKEDKSIVNKLSTLLNFKKSSIKHLNNLIFSPNSKKNSLTLNNDKINKIKMDSSDSNAQSNFNVNEKKKPNLKIYHKVKTTNILPNGSQNNNSTNNVNNTNNTHKSINESRNHNNSNKDIQSHSKINFMNSIFDTRQEKDWRENTINLKKKESSNSFAIINESNNKNISQYKSYNNIKLQRELNSNQFQSKSMANIKKNNDSKNSDYKENYNHNDNANLSTKDNYKGDKIYKKFFFNKSKDTQSNSSFISNRSNENNYSPYNLKLNYLYRKDKSESYTDDINSKNNSMTKKNVFNNHIRKYTNKSYNLDDHYHNSMKKETKVFKNSRNNIIDNNKQASSFKLLNDNVNIEKAKLRKQFLVEDRYGINPNTCLFIGENKFHNGRISSSSINSNFNSINLNNISNLSEENIGLELLRNDSNNENKNNNINIINVSNCIYNDSNDIENFENNVSKISPNNFKHKKSQSRTNLGIINEVEEPNSLKNSERHKLKMMHYYNSQIRNNRLNAELDSNKNFTFHTNTTSSHKINKSNKNQTDLEFISIKEFPQRNNLPKYPVSNTSNNKINSLNINNIRPNMANNKILNNQSINSCNLNQIDLTFNPKSILQRNENNVKEFIVDKIDPNNCDNKNINNISNNRLNERYASEVKTTEGDAKSKSNELKSDIYVGIESNSKNVITNSNENLSINNYINMKTMTPENFNLTIFFTNERVETNANNEFINTHDNININKSNLMNNNGNNNYNNMNLIDYYDKNDEKCNSDNKINDIEDLIIKNNFKDIEEVHYSNITPIIDNNDFDNEIISNDFKISNIINYENSNNNEKNKCKFGNSNYKKENEIKSSNNNSNILKTTYDKTQNTEKDKIDKIKELSSTKYRLVNYGLSIESENEDEINSKIQNKNRIVLKIRKDNSQKKTSKVSDFYNEIVNPNIENNSASISNYKKDNSNLCNSSYQKTEKFEYVKTGYNYNEFINSSIDAKKTMTIYDDCDENDQCGIPIKYDKLKNVANQIYKSDFHKNNINMINYKNTEFFFNNNILLNTKESPREYPECRVVYKKKNSNIDFKIGSKQANSNKSKEIGNKNSKNIKGEFNNKHNDSDKDKDKINGNSLNFCLII